MSFQNGIFQLLDQTLEAAVDQSPVRRSGRGSQLVDTGRVVSEHPARMS